MTSVKLFADQWCYSKGDSSKTRVHTALILHQTFWQITWSKNIQKSKDWPCTSIRPKIPDNVTYSQYKLRNQFGTMKSVTVDK